MFVSHSTKDKPVADPAVAAPESRVMLLIYSANANASTQIQHEVERAANRNPPISGLAYVTRSGSDGDGDGDAPTRHQPP